jgi:hypothetical protein
MHASGRIRVCLSIRQGPGAAGAAPATCPQMKFNSTLCLMEFPFSLISQQEAAFVPLLFTFQATPHLQLHANSVMN